MRVCIVAEGCYPYVIGGVSSWIHSMINSFPNLEFVVLTIIAGRDTRGKFVYDLPENVTEVHEVYLDDVDWAKSTGRRHKKRLREKDYYALRSLLLNQQVEWPEIFDMFQKEELSINDLLMGPDFFKIARDVYNLQHSQIIFSDFLWTIRSMYLPLFLVLKAKVPRADLYHCVATGYAGVLGAMAQYRHHCGLLISEHGIYTREREEELIRATWVKSEYKNIWIDQFYKMSALAYQRADKVTCLYGHAKELQIGLGCPEEKIMITPNGVNVDRLANLPQKEGADAEMINIGAVLRVTPIKDVKTLIHAFDSAKRRNPRLKLWIMGPTEEDPEYAQECFELIENLQVHDVVFTGRVDIRDYLGKMDMTVLTSISEGQPLTILESYAAHKPVIATDVGNCRGLLYGDVDDFGEAGILTHIMNLEEIAEAMLDLARDGFLRKQMGEVGYRRVTTNYRIEDMHRTYQNIYQRFCMELGLEWQEGRFTVNGMLPAEEEEK